MAYRAGLEPATLWVETICAIHCATDTKMWPRRDLNPQPIGYEPTALTIELQGRNMEGGMGIEPMLVQHLWNTDYKSVGASNYTNLPFKIWWSRWDSNPQCF